jgi:hypothetical protein
MGRGAVAIMATLYRVKRCGAYKRSLRKFVRKDFLFRSVTRMNSLRLCSTVSLMAGTSRRILSWIPPP